MWFCGFGGLVAGRRSVAEVASVADTHHVNNFGMSEVAAYVSYKEWRVERSGFTKVPAVFSEIS
jgi:hypothetical protein